MFRKTLKTLLAFLMFGYFNYNYAQSSENGLKESQTESLSVTPGQLQFTVKRNTIVTISEGTVISGLNNSKIKESGAIAGKEKKHKSKTAKSKEFIAKAEVTETKKNSVSQNGSNTSKRQSHKKILLNRSKSTENIGPWVVLRIALVKPTNKNLKLYESKITFTSIIEYLTKLDSVVNERNVLLKQEFYNSHFPHRGPPLSLL